MNWMTSVQEKIDLRKGYISALNEEKQALEFTKTDIVQGYFANTKEKRFSALCLRRSVKGHARIPRV